MQRCLTLILVFYVVATVFKGFVRKVKKKNYYSSKHVGPSL